MAEKEQRANIFKLDSNIDITYVDATKQTQIVKNAIQVVGETDGIIQYPTETRFDAPFSFLELEQLKNNHIEVDNNISVSGNGILYDEQGIPFAYAGDLVFRNADGTASNLDSIYQKANSINVDNLNNYYLNDTSLRQYNTQELGINLDDLINQTIKDSNNIGTGNIIQLSNYINENANSTAIYTRELSSDNYVTILASVMLTGTSKIQLRDVSSNTILDSSYVHIDNGRITPLYLSYTGTLPDVISSSEVTEQECGKYIWDSFLKRFFTLRDATSKLKSHRIAIEVVEGSKYIRGAINIICSDYNTKAPIIKSNTELITSRASFDILFLEPMPSSDYSITLQQENNTSTWYTNKTTTGFTANFENIYTGILTWSAIYVEK